MWTKGRETFKGWLAKNGARPCRMQRTPRPSYKRYLSIPSVPLRPKSAVKLAHWLQPLTSVPGPAPLSIRSPLMVTPTGATTLPPPSDAGHEQLPRHCAPAGRVFISVMAQTFFV